MAASVLPVAPWWIRMSSAVVRRMPAGRYRAMHVLGRLARDPFLARLPKSQGGVWYRCDLRDAIAREACFVGQYEAQETALLKALLKPGMTFVDVGANWGYFTLLAAALVGPQGRVISLEPDPRLHPVLQENLAVNQYSQVTALPVAASDREQTLCLAGFQEDGGNWGVSHITNTPTSQSFQVRGRPLDDLLDELHVSTADLVKIDIEGAEGLALAGMRRGLARGAFRRLLIELHPTLLPQHGHDARQLIGTLRKAGYRGWHIDHSLQASRRAAYCAKPNVAGALRPLEEPLQIDNWPHQLWLAPGVEPLSDS